jgi:hypothetical protein
VEQGDVKKLAALAPGAGHERRKVEDQAVRLAHFLDYEFCHHRPGRCCSLVILFPTCDKCKTTPLGCTSLAAAQFSFHFILKVPADGQL